MRDRTVGETFFMFFTTRAFATGIPTVLAGTPVVSAYEDASITQITAGITLGVDHDGVVGLNLLTLVATGANGYEAGKDYSMVITTGTVGGVSVVGEVVGEFSLSLSAAATELANATDGLTALRTLLLDIPTVSEFDARTLVAASYFDPAADAVANVTLVATTTTNTDMRGTDSAALASVATEARLAELDAANLPADLDAVLVDTGTTLPARFTGVEGATFATATDSLEAIRDRGDAAWTTGAGTGLTALANGTAQGGTSTTIQLAAGETFANSEPNGNNIKITSGTGSGQSRVIISYVGSTDTATIAPAWTTTPDATSVYEMVNGSVNLSVFNLSEVTTSLETSADIADAVWDEVLTGATHNIADSAGRRLRDLQEFGVYEGGAIWIDTVNGAAGTTDFESGTAFNPVDSMADANTLAASLGLSKFEIASGSSITLAASQLNQTFMGENWTLALGSQNIDGSVFFNAVVTGIATNTTGEQHFHECAMGAVTLPADSHCIDCGIAGTQTFGEVGDFFYDQCHSAVAGAATPTVDFGAGLNASTLHIRHHSGGWTVENMGAGTGTYEASFEGNGQIIWAASCSATSNASIRGNWQITDNASGAVTETLDDNQTGVDAAVALFTTQLTEAYAADGVAPTPAQALFLIQQMLTEFGIVGTTLTVREIDGTTTAATFTLDDGTNPTDITRAT